MTAEEGWFRPIGNSGWRTRSRSSKWDQQPLEIFKLALALEEGAVALEEAGKQGVALLLAYDQGAAAKGGSAEAGAPGGDRGTGGFRGAGAIRAPEVGIALAVRSETEDGQVESRGAASTASESAAHAIEVADYAAQLRSARNRCLQWFFGDNDLGAIMADPSDGSGCDGLQEDGPNVNCGAESTIAYLMTAALCR